MIDRPAKIYPSLVTRTNAVEPGTSHAFMLQMLAKLGSGARVLEIGCATGYMSRLMTAAGLYVVGVEIDPNAAAEACDACDEVIVADLDQLHLADLLGEAKFDAVVFGDVLEHLKNPARVLEESRTLLAHGGMAVISIPNVAHASVRLALLDGAFDYQNLGLLDDTHLRFFTLRSVRELCANAGFTITNIERTKVPIFSGTDLVPEIDSKNYDDALIDRIKRDPEHDTLQFIISAEALSEAERTRKSVESALAHEHELRLNRARIASLEAELGALREEHGLSVDHINNLERELLPLRDSAPRARAEADRLANELASRAGEFATARAQALEYAGALVAAKDLTILRDNAIDALRHEQVCSHDERAALERDLILTRAEVNRLTAAMGNLEAKLAEANSRQANHDAMIVARDAEIEVARAVSQSELARVRENLRDAEAALERARGEIEIARTPPSFERVLGATIATLNLEIAEIQREIDATHASVFWRLKVALNRRRSILDIFKRRFVFRRV